MKGLVAETRTPVPMTEGRPARIDYEYERNGTANVFMLFAPLEGWRRAQVTDRRTAIDYAHILKDLSDIHFPRAKKIVLVQDNLNTHAKASLYEAFAPAEARRSASNGITRRSMAVGSTWQSPSWAFWPHNAWIAASPISKRSAGRSPHGKTVATNIRPRPIGASQPPMRG